MRKLGAPDAAVQAMSVTKNFDKLLVYLPTLMKGQVDAELLYEIWEKVMVDTRFATPEAFAKEFVAPLLRTTLLRIGGFSVQL